MLCHKWSLFLYSSHSRCSNLISIASPLTAFIHQLALADLFCYCPTLHLFYECYVSGDHWSLGCVLTGHSVVKGWWFLATLQLSLSHSFSFAGVEKQVTTCSVPFCHISSHCSEPIRTVYFCLLPPLEPGSWQIDAVCWWQQHTGFMFG